MMRQRVISVCILAGFLFAAVPVSAGTNTVYSFLRSDMNARAAALAGSFVSITDDPTTLYYNPASIGTLTQPRGTVGFFKNLMDVNAGSLTYGQEFEDIGTFAAGVIYQNYGSFTETNEYGTAIGSFSASDLALSIGYSNTLDSNLYWGAAVKVIYSSIADANSSAIAGDVGLLYRIPTSRIAIGASIRNIGRQMSTYGGTREPLPLDASFGFSVSPKGIPLLLNFNFHKLNQDVDNFGERFRSFTVGGEFTLSRVLLLRVGFNNEERKDLNLGTTSSLAGFSAGLGVNVSKYRVDYGITSLGTIGILHRVSISTTF